MEAEKTTIKWQRLQQITNIEDQALCVVANSSGDYILCRYDKKRDLWVLPDGTHKGGGAAICIIGDAPAAFLKDDATINFQFI